MNADSLDLAVPPNPQYIGLVPVSHDDYLFGLERITTVWPELVELGAQEWAEVGDEERLGEFEPDWATCAAHERQGNIGVVSVRRRAGGELVGYFVGTIGVPLKTRGRRVFNEVGVYLIPEARRGWLFKAFMDYVEDVAKLFECDALIVSHRPEHDRIGVLYRRLGYLPLAHDYIRALT